MQSGTVTDLRGHNHGNRALASASGSVHLGKHRLLKPSAVRLTTAVTCLLVAMTSAASAGAIVVSGDITPTFSLTDLFPNSATPGPQQFFGNVLGSGQQVVILDSSVNALSAPEIDAFYNSLSGVSATTVSGAMTSSQLTNIDLLVLPAPDDAFSAAEITAISNFVTASGSLFVMGEAVHAATVNPRVNSLLAGIGSGMSLNLDTLDIGNQQATGGSIVTHPLTSGVTAFNYGATSTVNGGDPLFLASTGAPFVAVEGFVPEPSTLALAAFGFTALAVWGWRRRR